MTSVSIREDGSLVRRAENGLGTGADASRMSPPADGRYPAGLIEEYQRLALMALTVALTIDEQTRLQELIAQITAIDDEDPKTQAIQARYDELDAKLEQIRLKAEALVNAKR